MKRAGRWLFNFAAAVSLVLFVAMAVMWVRSYQAADVFGGTYQARSRARSAELYTTNGSIGIAFVHSIDHRPNYNGEADTFGDGYNFYAQHRPDRPYLPDGPASWGGHGFWFDGGDDTPGWRFQNNIRIIEVPLWTVVVITLILPSMWFIRRRRPVRPGFCTACGYDLRATPARCPECGAIPRGAKGAAI